MQESFIQHIWSLQYFDKSGLNTTEGEPVEIFEPGHLNTDAGPDFSNARLKLGAIQWVGNVEIHFQSSNWYEHRHDDDRGYDNVILHVVWTDDRPVMRRDGTRLPTIALRGRVNDDLIRNYRQLVGSAFSIPCERNFPAVEEILRCDMTAKALACRLERKAEEVSALLQSNGNNWEETTYQLLARAFGFKINQEPFLQLARALPSRTLQKQADLVSIEALLFGVAGFLEEKRGDDYFLALQKEYRLLAHKYTLRSMSRSLWLFLRLRPPNFPTVRLAQFAGLMHHRRSFFSLLLDAESVSQLAALLEAPVSAYWSTHYAFSKPAKPHSALLGRSGSEVILLNAVVPLLAAYARWSDEPTFMDRSLKWLEELPAEENAITRKWNDLGFRPRNSFESQGQIELFNTFCRRKRCLQCAIGAAIIRPPDESVARPH